MPSDGGSENRRWGHDLLSLQRRYQVIEERDSADELQARYTYGSGIDEPLTMERGGNVYYYHRDGLGSVTELSDQSGALVERYEYDVYGAPTIFDSNDTKLTASSIETPYLFTGRRDNPEAELQHYSLVLNRTLPGFETLAGLDRGSMYLHNAVLLPRQDLLARAWPLPANRPAGLCGWVESVCVCRQ